VLPRSEDIADIPDFLDELNGEVARAPLGKERSG
jgi:hypothetical protein